MKITSLLIVMFAASGYAVGTRLQSNRSAKIETERYSKYDAEHSAWLETRKQWARDYEIWKAKQKENTNVRRSVSTTASTRASTYTDSAEPGPVRRATP
jgi:hypothetical protein